MVPTLSYTIWFSQRTGSSLLTTALEATGIAGHPHEWMETPEGKGLLDHYKAADGAALAARLHKCGSTDNGLFGAKVSYRDPRMTEAFDLLLEVPGCPADASRPEVWAHIPESSPHLHDAAEQGSSRCFVVASDQIAAMAPTLRRERWPNWAHSGH